MVRQLDFYPKFLRSATYLLCIFVLFPSCVGVNIVEPQTIEQTAKYNNRRITIRTLDDNKYKLKWIEEEDENIVSLKNTKKVIIETSKIKQIRVEQTIVSLDSALNHNGNIQIKMENRTYNLLSMKRQDDQTIGIKRTGKEIIPVVIPKDQITKIKVKDKGTSPAGNVVIAIVIATGLTLGIFLRI